MSAPVWSWSALNGGLTLIRDGYSFGRSIAKVGSGWEPYLSTGRGKVRPTLAGAVADLGGDLGVALPAVPTGLLGTVRP